IDQSNYEDDPIREKMASLARYLGGERPMDITTRYAVRRLARELATAGATKEQIFESTLSKMTAAGIDTNTAIEALRARLEKAFTGMESVPLKGEEGELGAVNTENMFIKQEDLPQYFRDYGPLSYGAQEQVPKVGPMKIPMGELINGKLRQPAPPVDLLRYRAGVVEISPDAVYDDFKSYSESRLNANEPFDKVIADYALERGLNDKLDGLKRYIAYKQASELREMYLTDDEKVLFKQAQEDGMKESGMVDGKEKPANLIGMLRSDHEIPLSLQAYTNGMFLDVAPNGSYLIRDVRTGDLLGR